FPSPSAISSPGPCLRGSRCMPHTAARRRRSRARRRRRSWPRCRCARIAAMKDLVRIAIALVAVIPTYAQAPASGKICGITFSGSLRSRLYVWDWFQPTAGDNSYAYSGSILRLGFSQSHDNTWDWNAEFAVPILLGLPSNANGTGPQQGALGLGA